MQIWDLRGAFLESLIKKYNWKRGAELGVWYGKTYFRLLENCPDLTLIGVDNWDPKYPHFAHHKNQDANRAEVYAGAEKFGQRAGIMEMDMTEAAGRIPDESLDFVFIDGDHTYEGCRRDIETWLSKIKADGWITGHDYLWPGVNEAVKKHISPVNCPILETDETWARPKNLTGGNAVTVCCIKWGDKYGPEYVNKLYSMVMRNVHLTGFDFVCFTEDPSGIDAHIRTEPLPCDHPGWWQKIGLFRESIPGVFTDKILFLDLDVVITGDLDPMLEHNADFVIAQDWPPEVRPHDTGYNSSVFLLRVGSRQAVWNNFGPAVMTEYPGDQDWIRAAIPDEQRFDYDWTPSYKLRQLQAAAPQGAKAVIFHGDPKPPDCGGWVNKMWK